MLCDIPRAASRPTHCVGVLRTACPKKHCYFHDNFDYCRPISFITPPYDSIGDGVLFSIDFFVSLFIYLSARLRQNDWTDLHEIFRESVEWPWDDWSIYFRSIPRNRAMRNTGRGLLCFRTTAGFTVIAVDSVCKNSYNDIASPRLSYGNALPRKKQILVQKHKILSWHFHLKAQHTNK